MSDTEGNLGVIDDRINVHRFFKVVDARNWGRVTSFFKLRDVERTTAEHSEMYLQDLRIISEHGSVSALIQRRARHLLEHFAVDEFRNEFATLLLNAGKKQAAQSAQSFHLNVIEGASGTLVKAALLSVEVTINARLANKYWWYVQAAASSSSSTLETKKRKATHISNLATTEFKKKSITRMKELTTANITHDTHTAATTDTVDTGGAAVKAGTEGRKRRYSAQHPRNLITPSTVPPSTTDPNTGTQATPNKSEQEHTPSDDDEGSDHDEDPDYDEDPDRDEDLPLVEASSPFADLVAQLYQKYRKYNHPSRGLAPSEPPPAGTIAYLHDYAAKNLQIWDDLDTVTKKSTLVSMSGILNTMDDSMAECLMFQEVKQACHDPDFLTEPVDVQSLLDKMKEKMGQRADIHELHQFCLEARLRNAQLKSEYNDEARIVGVVEYLITLIKQNAWSSTSSEAEYVCIWRHVFGILLGDTVATRIGELSVKETRKERLLQETTFAFKEHNIRGRKVDLLFQAVYKDHKGKDVRTNLAVFEAKSSTASTDILRVQARKNLRLNKALLTNLRSMNARGQSPLILDMQGARAYIYTIKKFGNVYGAGSVTDRTIRLPTSEWELFAFIGRPDLILLLKVANRLQSLDTLVRMAALDQEEQAHHHTMTSTSSALAAQDSPSVATVWSPSTVRTASPSLKHLRPYKKVAVRRPI
ncbi:hypothetical protein BGZ49_009886 [Haplosporangium sp. Z 27]|nr:hypothetical protein BGZ49_009886 [Haplosporangium sp. Z 27]